MWESFPMIDWTINVGNIAVIITMIMTAAGIVYGMRGDIRLLKHDLKHLEQNQDSLNEAFTQLGSILTQVAVQDTRISMIEKSVDELRHGQGFIRLPK